MRELFAKGNRAAPLDLAAIFQRLDPAEDEPGRRHPHLTTTAGLPTPAASSSTAPAH
jgi:hypothetical protein